MLRPTDHHYPQPVLELKEKSGNRLLECVNDVSPCWLTLGMVVYCLSVFVFTEGSRPSPALVKMMDRAMFLRAADQCVSIKMASVM